MIARRLADVVGVAVVAAACSSSPSAPQCSPGDQQPCTCANGVPSVQECRFDQTYDACKCIDAGGGDSGSCDFSNESSQMTPTMQNGAPPTMTGGPIADGTYVVSSVIVYGQQPTDDWDAATIVVLGNAFQLVADSSVGGTPDHFFEAGTFTVAGNAFTSMITCPPGGGGTLPYTASPTTFDKLQGIGGNELWHFVKQ